MKGCHRRDGTINRRLYNFLTRSMITPPNSNPTDGIKTYDINVDRTRDLWFRVFVPTASIQQQPTSNKLPVIVFFHGGGFVYLSPDLNVYDTLCRRLAREISAIIVSVNYRPTPEHRFPALKEDGLEFLKFLDNADQVLPENADLSCSFLAGDSAGANIAHHVAVAASQTNFERVKVIGLVSIQPYYGGEERTESEKRIKRPAFVTLGMADWMWEAFLQAGKGYNRDYYAINVSGPNAADISELEYPPTLVFTGGFDILQDWQRSYYKWLKKLNKEAYLSDYPNMFHAFYLFPELPESGQLISQVKEFVERQNQRFS